MWTRIGPYPTDPRSQNLRLKIAQIASVNWRMKAFQSSQLDAKTAMAKRFTDGSKYGISEQNGARILLSFLRFGPLRTTQDFEKSRWLAITSVGYAKFALDLPN